MKNSNRVCRNSFNEYKSFANLPVDILFAIFLRLPSESIMCCRYVCKSWYLLTRDPLFMENHMNGEGNRHRLLIYENPEPYANPGPNNVKFLLVNIDDEEIRCVPRRNLKSEHYKVESNCNGLLCLSSKDHKDRAVLYNPMTGESITLPRFPQALQFVFNDYFTLGFDIVSQKYKVIRTFENLRMKRKHYMITVGKEDKWKRLSPLHGVRGLFVSQSISWNGTIFWTMYPREHGRCSIVAFNLHVKSFQVIPLPEILRQSHYSKFFSLLHMRDYLALIQYVGSKFRLWKVRGERIGEYFLIFEREYNTRMELEKTSWYEVVGELSGGGFLLQVSVYGENRRVYFVKFLPEATTPSEAIQIQGMRRRFTTLINCKLSLMSLRSI